MQSRPDVLHPFARAILPDTLVRRIAGLPIRDAGHGYDALGLSRDGALFGAMLTHHAYERYFRVESRGIEHVPAEGAAILASNHSGVLPVDALMLWTDVLRRTDPPRLARPVVDFFVPGAPFVGTLFARCGAVSGARGNVRHLLEKGELLLVFPEGVPGVAKGVFQRYRLREFRVGHAELALAYRAPVVPVAVVGAEEAWALVGRLEGIRLFGAPYLPVPATLLPIPVRFHIRYGPPIALHEEFHGEDPTDPELARRAAARVRSAVQGLVDGMLRERAGLFR